MTLSSDKTKWLALREGIAYKASDGQREGHDLRYGEEVLEQVDIFKYLGLWFDHEGSLSTMCTKRLEAG